MKLRDRYFNLAEKHIRNKNEIETHWKEIEENYSAPARHYHTLKHLDAIFNVLTPVWDKLESPNTIEWAVFYHDIIYVPGSAVNEKQSADTAFAMMMSYGIEKKTAIAVHDMILATKTHESEPGNKDLNYFLDADLSILGAERDVYKHYCEDVRKEFADVREEVFNIGRSAVMETFLLRERIFKTNYFYSLFEKQARANIEEEIRLRTLSS